MPDGFQAHLEAFKRILDAADRPHLSDPFQRSSPLRAKHFPGAGRHIPRHRLRQAYLQEFTSARTDWQLIEHATWPWVRGHAEDLTFILDDLSKAAGSAGQSDAAPKLDPKKQQQMVRSYTRTGAEEIAAFWSIFIHAGRDYQKTVLGILSDVRTSPDRSDRGSSPPPAPPPEPATVLPMPESVRTGPPELDPSTRSFYALLGILIFFLPSLLLVGIQYWRQPGESHWIVVGIAALLGLLTLACLIGYLRKRPG